MKRLITFLRTGVLAVLALIGLLVAPAASAQTTAPAANADLSALHLSQGSLIPAFVPDITEYRANVFNGANSLTVTPTSADSNAAIHIAGAIVANGTPSITITLTPDGETSIPVVVINGSVSKTYTIRVTHRSPLPSTPLQHEVPFGWSLIPPGLGAGDTFRLLFITNGSVSGGLTCNVPSRYVSHVVEHAQSGHSAIGQLDALTPDNLLSAKFRPLASMGDRFFDTCNGSIVAITARQLTNTDPQRDAATDSPIYWLGGEKVADDYADLYDGGWDSRAGTHETGAAASRSLLIWTGTTAQGMISPRTKEPREITKLHGMGGQEPTFGRLDQGDGKEFSVDYRFRTETHPMYALSPMLRVQPPLGNQAALVGLQLTNINGAVALTPAFNRDGRSFRTTVQPAALSMQVTPTAIDSAATIRVNGVVTPSGVGTPVALAGGQHTTITIEVTSADESVVLNYEVLVTSLAVIPPAPAIQVLAADSALKPDDIDPGELFRLMYVSDNRVTGSNPDYRHYNNRASESAAAGHAEIRAFSDQFRALVSTEFIHAHAHTDTATNRASSPPIYWLGGGRVADDYFDFYDGRWDSRAATDHNGDGIATTNVYIMTGSTLEGARDPGFEVGGLSDTIRAGRLDRGHRIEINSAATVGRNDAARMYVLSPQLRTMPRVDDASLGQLRLYGLSIDGNGDIPLSPQFDSANTVYTALAENDVATAQLTVRARAYFLDPGPTIRISVDGEQGSASSADNVTKLVTLQAGDTPISIEVTSSDRSTTKTYTLVVTRVGSTGGVGPLGGPVDTSDSNSALSAMSLSHGILNPSFDRGTLIYTARVANGVADITITPTAEATTATVHVAGELVAAGDSSATIALEAGVAKDIAIVGTAENNSTTNYTLRVTRAAANASANANLSSLSASTLPQSPPVTLPLVPPFAANTVSYTIDVLNEVTRITLFPSVADDDAVITIDGVVVPSSGGSQVELGEGSNRVDMLVTAADAVTTRTYTVITTRASINANSDARLNDLSLSNGTLTPAFHIGGTSYTATVAAAIGTVRVTPTAVFAGATITVNSATVASGAASAAITLTSGANSVTIQVRSADGTVTRLYTVTVIRNRAPTSNLSSSQAAIANTAFTYTFVAFSDVDGHALSYTADNLPGWLTFDGPRRTFSGIPSTADVTTSLVPNYRELTVTASDGFDSASGTFRLRVEQGPPLPPTGVTAVPGPTDEDQITVSWMPVPVEQNGASPVNLYAATAVNTTNPADTFGCTVGGPAATTCSIYSLTTGDEYSISVTAFNGLASAPSSPAFATPNARPSVANAVAAQTATVNTPFSFTLPSDTFTDDGPGALTYSSSGQPAWFTFDGIDTWSGTPDVVDDVGVRITVTATDGVFDETEKFRISVVAAPAFVQTVADAQYFTDVVIPALSLPSAVSTHPAALNYTLHPTDGEVLANSDGTFTPVAGLIFDPVTLTLSGAPTTAGSTLLRYTATDVNSAAAGLTFTVTVTTNTVPTDIILSPTPTAIDENVVANTIVGTLSVTDATPTGAEVYTVPAGVGGIDNGAFTITDDMLAINAPPDYETQSSYSIRIQVTDGALTYTKAFTITVNDLTETALFTVVPQNGVSLPENTEYTTTPTIAANGSPPVGELVWSLGGEDADDFSIVSTTGVVTLSARDYEAPTDTGGDNSYQFTMIVIDMGANVSAESTAITIIVTDVNEAPTDIILSATTIDENAAADALVGTLSVIDDALAGGLTYTLVTGSGADDNGAFSIIGTTLSINAAPDFEAKPSYNIRIQVADGALIYAEAFTIMVTNLSEAPIIANSIPNQGATVNIAFAYTIPTDTFTDGDNDSLSYSSSGQPDWLTFTTDRWHGIPSTTASAATISVTADDGTGNSVTDTFTITVNSALSLQGVDDQIYTAGVAIPILTMPRASGGTALLTYSLTPLLPGLTFSPSDRMLSGTPSPTTAASTTTMTYRVIDANGAEAVQTFTITVNDRTALFTVVPQGGVILAENTEYTSATPTIADNGSPPVGELVWSLGGEDADDFSIDPDTGVVTLPARDYEVPTDTGTDNTYQFTMIVTDMGANVSAESTAITIIVTDVNEAPTDIILTETTIDENVAADAIVGTLSVTDDALAGGLIYTLVTGSGADDNGAFSIIGTTLSINAAPDFEVKPSYNIRIQVADGALIYAEAFTIMVTNLSEAPIIANSIPNQGATVNIAFAYTIPADTFSDGDNDSLSYSSSGQPGWLTFTTDRWHGTPLTAASAATISVTADDGTGNSVTDTFTITVNSALSLPGVDDQNYTAGVAIPILTMPEANGGTALLTYSLTPLLPGLTFSPSDRMLSGTPSPTTAASTTTMTYRVIDANGAEAVQTFTITVNDRTALFTVVPQGGVILAENTEYTSATPTIADNGSPPVGELVWSLGGEDADDFSIDPDTGVVTLSARDYEVPTDTGTDNTYQFTMIVTDMGANVSAESTAITIIVTDVNEAPTDIILSATTIDENAAADALLVGTLSVTDDALAGDLTYTLVTGSGADDNGAFSLSGTTLSINAAPDFEAKPSYNIRIQVADGALIYAKAFTISVTDLSEAPIIANSIPPQGATVNIAFAYTIPTDTFTDGDNDSLSYSSSGQPGWLTFTTDRWDGIPSTTASAATISVTADDGTGNSVTDTFTITVNSAISLQGVDDQIYTAGVDIPILTMPEASGGTAPLSYSLTPPLPGLTFSASGRTLRGTPISTTVATTMTYRVIDANGAEAVQPFTITVNSAMSLQAVDDQIYTAGVAIPILTMPEASGGTAPLSYSLTPPLPGLTFSASVRTLSGTPAPTTATSTTTMTCRVIDINGAEAIQTFTITINPGNAVSSELLASHERINTMILSNASQAITATTLSKVAERIHTVDNPAAAYQFGGQSSLSGLLKSHGQAALEGSMDVERLFNGASFVLPLQAAEGDPNGVGALMVWGGSEYRSLDSDENGLDWDGEVVSVHLGVDTVVSREVLTGIALSWNRGRFDYLDEDGSSGEYQYRTNNIHPYFGWRPSIGFSLWATAGYGRGDITIDADDDAGNTVALAGERSTDTSQLSLAGGLNGRILRSATLLPGGMTTVNLKSDFALVRVEVDEDMEGFVAQEVDSHRMRLLLSGEQRFELARCGVVTPSLEVGTRYDGGDGAIGSGLEWGLGLRYASHGGNVSMAGNIRTLLSHNYNERGADLAFRLSPPSGRGLSLSLHPTWGKTHSASDQLWHDGIGQLSGGDAVLRRSIDSEVGYGMTASLLGKVGVLTPYTGLNTTDATRRLRLGGRFAGGDGAILTLEGTQENTTDGVSRELRLRGEMAF